MQYDLQDSDSDSGEDALNDIEEHFLMTETEEQQMELLEYISEMLNLISSGDDTVDAASIEVVADTVHARAIQLHAEYRKLLQANRKHLLKEIKEKNRNSANVDESAA